MKGSSEIMARHQASSIQNSSHLGYLKCQENGPEKALERWETELTNCEVTPQAVWHISKSLTKRG
jgi:hypothetical protein